MPGKIFPKNAMIFRSIVGEAEGVDGKKYEMTTSIGNSCPIVYSKKTGKCFVLGWNAIIQMAVEAGVDQGDEIVKEGGDGGKKKTKRK